MNKTKLRECARLLRAVAIDLGQAGSALVCEAGELEHATRNALSLPLKDLVQVDDLALLLDFVAKELERQAE